MQGLHDNYVDLERIANLILKSLWYNPPGWYMKGKGDVPRRGAGDNSDCAAGLQAYDDPACSDGDSACRLFLPDSMTRFPPGSFVLDFPCTGDAWRFVPQGCGGERRIVGPGGTRACSGRDAYGVDRCKAWAQYEGKLPPLPPLCEYSDFRMVERTPRDYYWKDLVWNITCLGGWMPSNVTAKAVRTTCDKGGPTNSVSDCSDDRYDYDYVSCALQWPTLGDAANQTAADLRKCVATWGCDWNEW
jgi:hypothetical protein